MLAEANKHPHLKTMEAFMYRFHPQWQKAKSLLKEGTIGDLKIVQSFFSYYNVDPNNIRNRFDVGGGGMLDIGCYCISLARFIFEQEPSRVMATIERDPVLKTDIKASGILDFSTGTSTFTCSTQLSPYQRVNICGSKGRIEIEIPFNAPPDKPTKLWLTTSEGTKEFQFDICDQYAIQVDLFSNAILNNTEVPTPFQDAVNNMKVIEAAFKSEETKGWVNC
jgi:predicted dehydrogenase